MLFWASIALVFCFLFFLLTPPLETTIGCRTAVSDALIPSLSAGHYDLRFKYDAFEAKGLA